MPAETTAPPTPNIVPATPPKPLPTPTTTLNVSELNLADPKPMSAPRPGSAKEKMWSNLRKKAGLDTPTETTTETPSKPVADQIPSATPQGGESQATPAPDSPPPPQPESKGKEKVSPWKLVDEYKGKVSKLEKELADTKSAIVPEVDRKALMDKVAAAEARNKELEDRIKFVDYASSRDFTETYDKPYQEAWKRSMMELQEVPLTDPSTGQSRPINDQDMFELVNLSLVKAKQVASELFGDFAGDVMQRRNELKVLLQKKHEALEEGRKNGAAKQQELQQAREKAMEEIHNGIRQTWQKVASEIMADEQLGPYFKKRDNDDNWNQRLDKGEELVSKVFAEMSKLSDPTIPPSERLQMIKRIVAVRNRAMGWSALKDDRDKLAAKVAELEKELKTYKSTTPPLTGSTPSTGNGVPMSARDRMKADLQRLAH